MPYVVTNTPGANSGVAPVIATGKIVTSGTAVDSTIALGFKPKYFRIHNITDHLTDEWFEGMIPDYTIHTLAAGDTTYVNSNGFTIDDNAVAFAPSTAYTTGTILVDSAGLYYRVIRMSAGNGTNIAGLVSQGDAVACSANAVVAHGITIAKEILITSKTYYYLAIG